MDTESCKNNCELDISLVGEFSKYYEKVRNHHWMVFKLECKTHLFAYKAYVQGKRQAEQDNDMELTALRGRLLRAESVIKLAASRKCGKMVDLAVDEYLYEFQKTEED